MKPDVKQCLLNMFNWDLRHMGFHAYRVSYDDENECFVLYNKHIISDDNIGSTENEVVEYIANTFGY